MELKRIMARDTRAANEKAVAMFGPDVLVISSSKVRGQTELIVAVDVAPLEAEVAVAEAFVPTKKHMRCLTSQCLKRPLLHSDRCLTKPCPTKSRKQKPQNRRHRKALWRHQL